MAANDDVLIVGKLDSKELEKSINDLIDFVGDKTTIMAGKFDSAMDKMKSAMKDFAITQKVSVDLMKEAWKDMSASFDAMVAAQSGATGGGKGKEPREYAPNTIGALEQEIEKRQQNRKEMELDSDALRQENKLIEERNKKLAEQKGLNTMAAQAKKAGEEIRVAFSHPANSLEQAEAKLAKLKALAANWKGKGVLDETQWNKIQNAIDRTEKSIEKFKMSAMTLKDLKLLPEKSVDDITKKLQALKHIQIDPKNAMQVKKLGDEYQRLSRMQNELLGRSIQLTKSNNYLAQSFGYIRNRIVYALTLGAATSFVKQVYDIRAQYELLERSLGVLIGSFERGSRIFQELNTMALKSPFTLMELGTAAKQLTAYNFQANEVVNTTRRLADLSAALGVPMERLTYNLGQIRAQTVLTARDARDFANAGLPIVKSLADHFSELEGRVVSTGDVYDRMSKKAVSYNDVMAVLNKMTDEGGKFFDFQAKQAETLRVQLANLTLAWNNMLNAVGKENQGMLTLPITALKSLFQNWKELSHVITEVVIALGLYKGTQLVVNKLVGESAMVMRKSILMDKEKAASELQREGTVRRLLVSEQKQIANKKKVVAADYQAILSTRELSKTQALLLAAFNKNDKELMKALVKLKLLKKSEIENITVGKAFSLVINQMGISLMSLGKTIAMFLPQMAAMAAIGAIVEAVYTLSEISDKIRDINKSIVDSAKESADSIAQFMKDYSETYKKVFEYQEKVQKNGVPATATKDGIPQYKNLNDAEALKAWDAIREQIELTSAASGVFIDKLMQINDVNDRVRAGFNYLQQIHDINGALESLDDKAVTINGDWSKWWNLWSLPDGLIDNLKDYSEQLDNVIGKWGSLANAKEAAMRKQDGAEGDLHDVQAQFTTFSNDLKDTISSMFNAFSSVGINTAEGMREAFERFNNQILADANLSSKEQLQYRMAAEEEFIAQRKAQFKEEYDFEIEQGNAARAARVKQEEEAWLASFGSGKAVSQAFFDWLKNQHASEINSMFGKMSRREIEQIDWSQPKWQKWAQDNAESFSKQYGISFDKLKGLVADANTWKIFLKLTITTDEKSVYDTLKDADAAANAAWTKIQRLKQRQAELNKIPATSLTDEQNEEAKNLFTELTQAQNDYNDAVAKGGHASKQAKANAKAQKTAEQEVNEALRQELSIIREVQSNYDKLRKSGVDDMQAAQLAAQGYADTLSRVNNILAKYGISKFNAKDFAGKDTRAILETLQKQRNDLIASGKVKAAGLKDMDVEIQKLTIDAKTYDYKKITDGLNSELGKIKDEYELAVELDANPELGDMFADMFSIDTSSLPHTFEQALAMVQSSVDNALSKLGIERSFDILKGDINAFAKSVKQSMDGDAIKELEKAQNYIRGIWKKNTEETIKDWNSLLEKYGDYQTKLIKAAQDTAQEQLNIVRKFGNDSEQAEALDLSKKITLTTDQDEVARIQKQLYELVNKVVKGKDVGIKLAASVEQGDIKTKAKIEWDNFKDSDYYTMMFEDMDRVSTRAIRSILAQLDLLKEKVKDDPASMKALMDAYKKGRDELESRAPFENIIESIKEWHQASVEAAGANRELADANRELESAQAELNNAQIAANNPNARFGNDAEKTERLAKAQERYTKAVKSKNQAEQNVAQAEIKQINAQTKFQNALNGSATALQNVGNLLTQFAELLGIAEDSEAGEMVKSLAQGFTMMATALSLVATVAAIAEMSLGWVAAVAAALTVVISLVSFLAGQSNRKITEQIEEIERDVHDLEIAYKNLEQAADEAYGAMTSGAKAALLANKQAQLEDLERQLELAKSRTGKHYDQDEVDNYQSEIVDLRNEIRDLTHEITNDLLDISSAGDGITDLVDAMIEAFKNGEDAMAAFGDKWDEMIDNMILKMLISTFMQKAWDNVMKTLEEKEDEFLQRASADRAEAQKNYDKAFDMSDDEIAQMIAEQLGYRDEMSMKKNDLEDLVKRGSLGVGGIGMTSYNSTPYFFVKAWQQVTDEEIAAYRKMLKDAVDSSMSATDQASVDFTKWALDYMNGEGRDYMTNYAEMLKAALGDWYSYGQDAQAGLSALQQGIQGISEDTAGALEAYMNSISQQVYLHSELLTQLRDALVNFDLDVQVATMSQMLLQLQQSYQVQLAIQNILNGWSNPSGMAVRVEMV